MGISAKQIEVLRFPYTGKDALICDGAVRAGKTMMMSISFLLWAMGNFQGQNFAICGHTVGSAERNVITPLLAVQYLQGQFVMEYRRGDHILQVSRGSKKNRFYIFGGRDESSYTLIQGLTLAGALLDEVTLMPRSFVEQTLARCSVEHAKFWFNCNPDSPGHWFYQQWLMQSEQHNALHLHFTMRDNPALSKEVIARYESLYSGVFYQRYIEGKWVMSEGVVYDMFDHEKNTFDAPPQGLRYLANRTIAVDYGTTNPCVFLELYDDGERIWVTKEYRWDSRAEKRQKTDGEYAEDMLQFMRLGDACTVICDPSAASFITALKNRGIYVLPGKNGVLQGIRRVASLFAGGTLKIHTGCTGLIAELGAYVWDKAASALGEERPIKENDHGADALRYYCMTALPDWRLH